MHFVFLFLTSSYKCIICLYVRAYYSLGAGNYKKRLCCLVLASNKKSETMNGSYQAQNVFHLCPVVSCCALSGINPLLHCCLFILNIYKTRVSGPGNIQIYLINTFFKTLQLHYISKRR